MEVISQTEYSQELDRLAIQDELTLYRYDYLRRYAGEVAVQLELPYE